MNGQDAGSSFADKGTLGQVFLNHYNDRVTDYTAHWHAGTTDIDSRDQCKNGSWQDAGFTNQGQCLRYVNSGQDSR